jgi:phage shock protein E
MKPRNLFAALSLLLWALCQAAVAGEKGEAVWIDVRSAEEYASDHVPEALNIPYEQVAEQISSLGLALDQPIYLYCGSGRRAGIALETLQQLGYQQVVNVGGLEDAQQLIAGEEKAGTSE